MESSRDEWRPDRAGTTLFTRIPASPAAGPGWRRGPRWLLVRGVRRDLEREHPSPITVTVSPVFTPALVGTRSRTEQRDDRNSGVYRDALAGMHLGAPTLQ
jgi:hypothetical protein